MRRLLLAVLASIVCSLACASNDWERVRAEDSPAAYRRFLREHPESGHAHAARERIAYLQLRRNPRPESFERFRAEFPDSAHHAELEVALEAAEFERARRAGSVAAYAAFLERFPLGEHAQRARGNAEYLRAQGFAGQLEALSEFVSRFPSSDYAEEARRSLSLLSVRERTRLGAVGLSIRVDPSTPGAERLAAFLRERAERTYAAAGIPLVASQQREEATASGLDGWLSIRHVEQSVASEFSAGRVVPAGVLATIEVTLERIGEDGAIWSETFAFRGHPLERRPGDSILFSARAPTFWSRFFVPVADWRTDLARHAATALGTGAVDVALEGDRSVVLFSDGHFRVIDLSDPTQPRVVTVYRRPRDLARFDAVRRLGEQVAVFGEGGLEIVALQGDQPRRVHALERGQVGALVAAEAVGSDLLLAGSQGLLRVSLSEPAAVERLLPQPVRDLAVAGGLVFFLDEQALYVAGIDDLRLGRIRSRVRLGWGFGPRQLRVRDGVAVVVGRLGVIGFDVRRPDAPQKRLRLGKGETGRVQDALVFGGRIFLLSERGLLVLDPRTGRIRESVDVEARSRLAAWGRHLVLLGSERLQVLDATPWAGSRAVAAATP